jgi:type IV secretion system protein TrbI
MADDIKSDSLENAVEKPVTYGKKAQIVGITLFALVSAGLLFQTISNVKNAELKKQTAAENEKANKVSVLGQGQESIDQFKDAQDKARLELEQMNKAKAAQEQHNNDLNNIADRTNNTAAGAPQGQQKATVEDVYYDFNIQETVRVLKARSASIGRVHDDEKTVQGYMPTNVGVNNARTNPELQRVQGVIEANQSKIDELRSNAKRLLEVAEQKSPGITSTMDGITPVSKPLYDTTNFFGQSANNRQLVSPSATGPQEGEVIIPTGTTISAILQQDVISDYPNTWIAVLQRPIYDLQQKNILLPTGSKIIGGTVRASDVNEAIQNRLGFYCNVIERGDGKRIDLKKAQGLDSAGIGALNDQVDYHILARMMGVAAYAVVGLGPSLQNYGTEPQSASSQAVTDITRQTRQVGRSVAEKYLSIVPTITIRAGTPIKIILQDDLYVTPWQKLTAASYHYAE